MARSLLYLGDSGVGKAQPLTSNILTKEGFKPMGEITIGDEIFGSDGNLHSVVDVIPQGKLNTYEVEFRDGTKVLCNDKHLWTVRSEKGIFTKTVEELSRLQYQKYKVPKLHPINFPKQERDTTITPYLLGVLLGDGYLTGSITGFSTSESYIVDKVRESLKFNPNLELVKDVGDNYSWVIKYKLYNGSITAGNPITRSTERLGIRVHSYEKFIPAEYLYSNIEDRVTLMQGLFDTDGSVDTKKSGSSYSMSYSTTSTRLKEDIVFLVQSLGYSCTVSTDNRKHKYTTGISYTIRIHRSNDRPLLYSSPKHIARAVGGDAKIEYGNNIKNITNLGYDTEMQCITTSSPDSLYVTDGFKLTHNSTSLRTLDPKETFIISPNIKELPFPGAENNYTTWDATSNPTGNRIRLENIKAVGTYITSIGKGKPHIKTIILEDLSHFYTHRTMGTTFIGNDDWSKWTVFATDVYNAIIKGLTLLRQDLTVVVIQHTEMKADGVIADKTVGKMLDKVKLPSWFTVVLHGLTIQDGDKTRYVCQTNRHGSYLAKSPPGMFKDMYVRNDMQEILGEMTNYYAGKSQNTIEFI